MSALWRDLRYSVRSLARSRGFTATVVLTLSLGIGGTITIFSAVNGVLLSPLPYPGAEDLFLVKTEMTDGRPTTGGMPPFGLTRINDQNSTANPVALGRGFLPRSKRRIQEMGSAASFGTPLQTGGNSHVTDQASSAFSALRSCARLSRGLRW